MLSEFLGYAFVALMVGFLASILALPIAALIWLLQAIFG